MSANNTYGIQKDSIDLKTNQYWYQLSFEPVIDSLRVQFDLSNNVTNRRFNDIIPYSYEIYDDYRTSSLLEYNLVKIVSNTSLDVWDNIIHHIPYTSTAADAYAISLIGRRLAIENQIVKITQSNYLLYKSYLLNKIFIDFTLSEKIKGIIDSLDPETGEMLYPQADFTYFYEIL